MRGLASLRTPIARNPSVAIGIALVLLVLLFPLLADTPYLLGLGVVGGAMAAASVGFVLPIGYAHQLVLGQSAFCMIGGYSTAILVTRRGVDPAVAMIVGALLSAMLAWLLGGPILRLRGFMLAMASLAIQLILAFSARELVFTGQALGISGIAKFSLFGWALNSDLSYYFFVWAVVFGFALVGVNVERSKSGRALKALGASESAASALGVNVARAKLEMFTLSAAMASVSGSLLVHYLRVMEPSVFDFHFSLMIVTAVVVGGLASVWGGIIGAVVFLAVREALRVLGLPYLDSLVMAVATCVMLIVLPSGLVGAIEHLLRRLAIDAADGTGFSSHIPAALPPMSISIAREGAAPLLTVSQVSRSFGALTAVNSVSFSIRQGSITAIIGPNGAGKTTLFNLISGFEPLDGGQIMFRSESIGNYQADRIARQGIARTFQSPRMIPGMTALDTVMGGGHRKAGYGVLAACFRTPSTRAAERRLRTHATKLIAWVGIHGSKQVDKMSFGQQRLVEVARALALDPDLLLMDEPASGLNDSETETLGRMIAGINSRGVSILLIEHDLRLVMGLADHVVVLHHGEKIAEGTPDAIRKDRAVFSAYLGQE